MIEVRGVSRRRGGREVLREVSFRAGPGGVTGFLGPNGAGKTTTLRILTTYLAPDAGTAIVAGHDVRRSPRDVRRSVGYLPEEPALLHDHTVVESLRFAGGLHGVGGAALRGRVADLVDRCGLAEVAGRVVGTLSRGYRQRVGLAQALVHDPEVLLLDEPTAGLDPVQIRAARALVAELAAERTVLLSTHILPEVTEICSSVVVLHRGTVVAADPVEVLSRGGELEEAFVRWTAGDPGEGTR